MFGSFASVRTGAMGTGGSVGTLGKCLDYGHLLECLTWESVGIFDKSLDFG